MKSAILSTAAGDIELQELCFSAKIDFLSFSSTAEVSLPAIVGRVHRPSSPPGAFTIHDAQPQDVLALASIAEIDRITTLEVAVDIRPCPYGKSAKSWMPVLRALAHDYVPRHLEPSYAPYINTQYRAYDLGEKRGPFNRKSVPPGATLCYGHKSHPVRVKSYLKLEDNKQPLPSHQYSVRVEVTLEQPVLDKVALVKPIDLLTFPLRRSLSPYFTFMSGVRRKAAGPKDISAIVNPKVLAARDQEVWDGHGVGGFLPGGMGDVGKVRFIRHQDLNNRVGQALGRLEQQLTKQIRVSGQAP